MQQKNANNELELMTFKEVLKLLKVKESKLRSAIFKREIPYIKIGALIRFNRNQLLEWLSTNTILPSH